MFNFKKSCQNKLPESRNMDTNVFVLHGIGLFRHCNALRIRSKQQKNWKHRFY